MAKKRFVIEGTWSGYTSSQSRVVHREYTTREDFAKEVEKLGTIRYTDGTVLFIRVREMEYRERKKESILSYTSLIRECINQKCNMVKELK